MIKATNFTFIGKAAWLLYDTYGFPIDLTTLIMEEKSMTINMAEYEEEKKKAQVLTLGIKKLGLSRSHQNILQMIYH